VADGVHVINRPACSGAPNALCIAQDPG